LSEFLTVPGQSVCTHEACEFAASAEEFWHNADNFCNDSKVEVYGNSDSAALYVIPALLAERPLTRVIWIDRNPREVMTSMRAAKIPHDMGAIKIILRLRDIYSECFDLVVPYHNLDSISACLDVWLTVMPPEINFDPERWKEFSSRRIAYGKDNPFPKKDYSKFFGWVQKELAQPVWKEW
jgi:hypothetical protein